MRESLGNTEASLSPPLLVPLCGASSRHAVKLVLLPATPPPRASKAQKLLTPPQSSHFSARRERINKGKVMLVTRRKWRASRNLYKLVNVKKEIIMMLI